MKYACRLNVLRFQRRHPSPVLYCDPSLVSLLGACSLSQRPDMERGQTGTIRLAKTRHAHLNHHDCEAPDGVCAETVRYRSRATQFAEVDEYKGRFLARYRSRLHSELMAEAQMLLGNGNKNRTRPP
ncbi:hypothetical protein [Spirosoma areae]